MKTGKRNSSEFRRSFLFEGLPEPMTPADSHWQIFDDHIHTTAIRLRSIRVPETNEWTRMLEKRVPSDDGGLKVLKVSQIFLDESEYEQFTTFKGRRLRKNRYFYNSGEYEFEIDIYLGELWGVNIAKVYFGDIGALENFAEPGLSALEISDEEFFIGENLVGKGFADVQEEFAKIKGG